MIFTSPIAYEFVIKSEALFEGTEKQGKKLMVHGST